MQRVILFLLTTTLTTTVFGQKYLTAEIRAKGDSILKAYIGDTLFNYSSYDTDTYYEYKDIFGKPHWETLNKFKKTKGKFVKVDMRWYLTIPYPQCPLFDTIGGMTSFVLDSSLNTTDKPYLEFIPDFFWTKSGCDFITKEKAISIAKEQNLKAGIEPIKAMLEYDRKGKTFHWTVSNYLTRWHGPSTSNKPSGTIEQVVIDATSGQVKRHEEVWYGPVY